MPVVRVEAPDDDDDGLGGNGRGNPTGSGPSSVSGDSLDSNREGARGNDYPSADEDENDGDDESAGFRNGGGTARPARTPNSLQPRWGSSDLSDAEEPSIDPFGENSRSNKPPFVPSGSRHLLSSL